MCWETHSSSFLHPEKYNLGTIALIRIVLQVKGFFASFRFQSALFFADEAPPTISGRVDKES